MWSLKNLDTWGGGGWGVFIALPPNEPLGRLSVDGRTGQSGAPPDTVRCTSHVTQLLGFWRFRPLELWQLGAPDSPVPHRTGTVQCPVRLLALLWLCTNFPRTVHICRRPLESTVALLSCCFAGTPDNPVNYSGAAVQKPEGEEWEHLEGGWIGDLVKLET
jgi:hypothetical protein